MTQRLEHSPESLFVESCYASRPISGPFSRRFRRPPLLPMMFLRAGASSDLFLAFPRLIYDVSLFFRSPVYFEQFGNWFVLGSGVRSYGICEASRFLGIFFRCRVLNTFFSRTSPRSCQAPLYTWFPALMRTAWSLLFFPFSAPLPFSSDYPGLTHVPCFEYDGLRLDLPSPPVLSFSALRDFRLPPRLSFSSRPFRISLVNVPFFFFGIQVNLHLLPLTFFP